LVEEKTMTENTLKRLREHGGSALNTVDVIRDFMLHVREPWRLYGARLPDDLPPKGGAFTEAVK
jgi:hypothetical protein